MFDSSEQKIPVRNPRTGQHDYEITEPSAPELDSLCARLRTGQSAWVTYTIEERVAVMQRWKIAVEAHKAELIEALSADTGRHWETLLEADLVASSIDRWCNISKDFFVAPARKESSIPFLEIQQDLVPYALVGVISPWNFPLLLSLIDTIPALLAGCAVVVKPSEIAPRFIEVINKTIEAVPELHAVLAYVAGTGATGAEVVGRADLICFTGSTATGRKVYQAACDRFIPVFLELGGKDAAIVLEGADLELASSALLWGSSVNAGQSCLSVERIYVQNTVYERFVALITQKAASVSLAFPGIKDGKIGPIISDKQVEIINDHLKDALAKGAKITTGSQQCEALGGGFYCRPTVLTHVDGSMKIMTEETFGPLMPVVSFATIEEGIALANSTVYGLSGAVFAKTAEEAMAVGARMHCGAVSINDAALTAIMHEGEKNSFKMSGIGGTRMGPSAIKRFMRQKVFLIKNNTAPDPWYFS